MTITVTVFPTGNVIWLDFSREPSSTRTAGYMRRRRRRLGKKPAKLLRRYIQRSRKIQEIP